MLKRLKTSFMLEVDTEEFEYYFCYQWKNIVEQPLRIL